jgi:hypothetical protein
VKIPETVICVPGLWRDRTELVTSIAENSAGYLYAGRLLMETATKTPFELQLERPDPRLAQAFRAAGGHCVTAADLARIESHRFVLYLIGQGGSRERAEALMAPAAGLVRAGGLAVKVESAGIAHSPNAWLDFVEKRYLFSAHKAFVVHVTGDLVYSCGMHNLGYADAIVDAKAAEDPVELLRTFTWYQFTENPTIRPGQTFSVASGAPVYRLVSEPCNLYEGDPLFTNPFGMWRLLPR